MNDSDLLTRLGKLEKSNRRLRFAMIGAVLVGGIIAMSPAQSPKLLEVGTLRADRIILTGTPNIAESFSRVDIQASQDGVAIVAVQGIDCSAWRGSELKLQAKYPGAAGLLRLAREQKKPFVSWLLNGRGVQIDTSDEK
jgi:hypothetical protein